MNDLYYFLHFTLGLDLFRKNLHSAEQICYMVSGGDFILTAVECGLFPVVGVGYCCSTRASAKIAFTSQEINSL